MLHSGQLHRSEQQAVALGVQTTNLRANVLPCHFWQRALAFGGAWQARLEIFGSTGRTGVAFVGLTPKSWTRCCWFCQLWQNCGWFFSGMACTFSTDLCSSFSGECLPSAEQMPRDICVCRGRSAALTFGGI